MARVEISESAARELRKGMAAPNRGEGLLLIQPGPAHEEYRGPEWTSENEAIGPPQRWHFLLIGSEAFAIDPELPPGSFSLLDVDGIKIMVFHPPSKSVVLNVVLIDGAIRVHETGA